MDKRSNPILRALFVGFGNVGQKVAEILFLEREKFQNLRELNLVIVGIVTKTRGSLANSSGVNVARALKEIREVGRFSPANPDLVTLTGPEAIRTRDYDVLVELSTLSIERHGEPALSHVREALRLGRHVVTANKGPVAFAYHELKSLALKNKCSFLHESTVMDGAPVFNLARSSLSGCRVLALSGILNSTTNFILSRMELGEHLDDALQVAQKEGFAEADPRYDVEGWDAAAKIAVLANALMGALLTPYDVERQGIGNVSIDEAQRAVKDGKHLKLICRAWREENAVRARVALEAVDGDSPFAGAYGTGSILIIETDLMGPILISQVNPTLYDTAYGVIQDLLTIVPAQRR